MTRLSIANTVILPIVLFYGSGALAQQCDPVEILRANTTSFTLVDETALIFASQSARSTTGKNNNSGKLGAIIYGIPVEVGYQTARAFASYVEAKTNVNYSHKEYQFYLNHYLSDNAVEAYKACIGGQAIVINAPRSAAKDDAFFLTVKWVQENFSPKSADMIIKAANGILGEGAEKAETITLKNATPGSEISVRLTARDPSKPTHLSVQVFSDTGSASGTLSIPPHRPFHVVTRVLTSERLIREADYEPITSDRCVTKKEGVLIPETARWNITKSSRGTRATINEGGTTDQVCGTLYAHGGDWGSARIDGVLTVSEAIIKPGEPMTSTDNAK